MSTTCEVPFEPLALDGSNYSSWHSNVLIALKVLGPTAEGIMVASILPKDETCVSPKELEKKRLNVVITNLLCSCVCRELKYLILTSKKIGEDAHLIWKLLFELVNTKLDEIEIDDEDEPAEMCPTTSTTSTDHRASTLEQEDKKGEDAVPLQGPVRLVTPTGQTGASRGTPICLMAKKEKKGKKKRQAKGAKNQKIEASSSPTRELEFLKSELASLVCKYETLANKYDHDIKSFACRAKIEEEVNDDLEAKLVKLTSEHMALQANHKELEYSYEKLVDSYATLEISHEVVLSSVKSIQPLSHTCTCSQIQVNSSCANDCLSQASQSSIEHVLVESCDDLIAKENDELKQEVEKFQKDLYVLKEKSKVQPSRDNREDMVKKLEKGSTITSSTPQQHTLTHKNKIQEKSKVGQAKSQYHPIKHKAQEPLLRTRSVPVVGG
jgi:hypothetical protein